jgi:hypothetical protein
MDGRQIAATTPLGLVSNPQLEHPVTVLCGAFLGPGSHAMAVTFNNGTCIPDTGWAVFRDNGGAWQLLDPPGHVSDVILPLTAAGDDIREEYAVYVYCQSVNRPHSVKLKPSGRFTVCRDRSRRTTRCLGDPGGARRCWGTAARRPSGASAAGRGTAGSRAR